MKEVPKIRNFIEIRLILHFNMALERIYVGIV